VVKFEALSQNLQGVAEKNLPGNPSARWNFNSWIPVNTKHDF
jgi:hypothetical protein